MSTYFLNSITVYKALQIKLAILILIPGMMASSFWCAEMWSSVGIDLNVNANISKHFRTDNAGNII